MREIDSVKKRIDYIVANATDDEMTELMDLASDTLENQMKKVWSFDTRIEKETNE